MKNHGHCDEGEAPDEGNHPFGASGIVGLGDERVASADRDHLESEEHRERAAGDSADESSEASPFTDSREDEGEGESSGGSDQEGLLESGLRELLEDEEWPESKGKGEEAPHDDDEAAIGELPLERLVSRGGGVLSGRICSERFVVHAGLRDPCRR